MPSSEAILIGLTAIANQWRPLAIGWHVFFGALVVALLIGWRPSNRFAAYLLALPFLSVSALAWTSSNPFNGATFVALVLLLISHTSRPSKGPVHIAPPLLFVPGALLVAFAWVYPHFLAADRWTTYMYAAPLGLLPCPTLSAVIGVTLIANCLHSKAWATTLGVAGFIYGAIGVFRLGVLLDYGLLAGAVVLLSVVACSFSLRSVHADGDAVDTNRRPEGNKHAA